MNDTSTHQRRPRRRKTSACRRVGGQNCDKNSKSEFPISSKRRHHGDLKTILWPESVRREERIPLSTGHRSFLTATVPGLDSDQPQEVNIQGHLFVLCNDSQLLIEFGGDQILIEPGQSVILSDTEVTITELQGRGDRPGTVFCFFPDEVLAECVSMDPQVASLIARAANYPTESGIIPIYKQCPSSLLRDLEPKNILRPLLDWVMNLPSPLLMKLCFERVVSRRIRIQLFLENLILQKSTAHAEIMEEFPGGKRSLLQEMRRLKMPSIAALIDQRRMELCYVWNTYGNRSFEETLPALMLSQPKRFLSRYERWLERESRIKFPNVGTNFHDAVLVAQPSYLRGLPGPFWQLREDAEINSRHLHRMETDHAYRQNEEELSALINRRSSISQKTTFPAGEVETAPPPSGVVEEKFWDLKSTGINMILKAENIASFPGLEDCEDLLLAA